MSEMNEKSLKPIDQEEKDLMESIFPPYPRYCSGSISNRLMIC